MKTESKDSLLSLDVSKALGFGMLYHPVIGQTRPGHYPIIPRFRRFKMARFSSQNGKNRLQ